jgi:uncharacterized membrane protein YkvA (DUF1232 family)
MGGIYKLLMKNGKRTAKLVSDEQKLNNLLSEAIAKANQRRIKITKVREDLLLLINLLKAYLKGQYNDIPLKTIIFVTAAIVYFVNPFDVIPDFISGFGVLDDATVLSFVASSLKKDLEKFKRYSLA